MSDEPKFAVYVIAIEDSQRAYAQLFNYDGIVSQNDVARDLTEEEAITIVDNLAGWNFDALAMVPK